MTSPRTSSEEPFPEDVLRDDRGSTRHAAAAPSNLSQSQSQSQSHSGRAERCISSLPSIDSQLFPARSGRSLQQTVTSGDDDGLDTVVAKEPDATAEILDAYEHQRVCGNKICNHGTFSPRPKSPADTDTVVSGSGDGSGSGTSSFPFTLFGRHSVWSSRSYDAGESRPLLDGSARRSGDAQGGGKQRFQMKPSKMMYFTYYFPFANWIRQYKLSYLTGDFIAALTVASIYIPMSLSLATNLGHVPAINGLYTFVFNPLVYALLGSCPQMVVGPEAAGSLLAGSVVHVSDPTDTDIILHARITGVVTAMAGAAIFIAGIFRLGFLDNVLSRAFLRGFISAIGFVILVDQLIPEMGLSDLGAQVSHDTTIAKIYFLIKHVDKAHALTCAMAFGSFGIIIFFRELKKHLQPRYPKVAFIPDRLAVVILSAVLTWGYALDERGLEVLGDVRSDNAGIFSFHFPFVPSHMKHVRDAMGTSFLIALLGFFESSVAAKALAGSSTEHRFDGIQGIQLSANRELVALGAANIVGGCFMGLPGFGGYGRSKVNASTGGKTPMSSVFLALITVICIVYLLPYFYYLPKAVLSSMISVVAYTLVEECPHDIKFFIKINGWSDLSLMFLVFIATILYSLSFGIALGIGFSVLSVIRHSTKPRIQILGKVPGTTNQFENAEEDQNDRPSLEPQQQLEFIEGCLIVKIPEPLTFANTGDLKGRLRRLEVYGTTTNVHPAAATAASLLPRQQREEEEQQRYNRNRNIIFDVHGVTSLDGCGAQVLTEIVEGYVAQGVRVFFCRVPKETSAVWKRFVSSGIVELCGRGHFVRSVDEALRMVEE